MHLVQWNGWWWWCRSHFQCAQRIHTLWCALSESETPTNKIVCTQTENEATGSKQSAALEICWAHFSLFIWSFILIILASCLQFAFISLFHLKIFKRLVCIWLRPRMKMYGINFQHDWLDNVQIKRKTRHWQKWERTAAFGEKNRKHIMHRKKQFRMNNKFFTYLV